MRLDELFTREHDIEEWKATKKLCSDPKRSDASLGASALSSCRSQGLRSRDSKVSAKYRGGERKPIKGKVKGKKYGGPLPDWS
jgi:hypothetical protein